MKNTFTSDEIVKTFSMKEETLLRWIEDGNFKGIKFVEDKWIFDIDSKWTIDDQPSLSCCCYNKTSFLHNPSEE